MVDIQPSEKIVELIQKLLALSKSPNEHEAALALSRAQDLLLKYNLEIADLQALGKAPSTSMLNFPIPLGQAEWKRRVLRKLALNNFCETLIEERTNYHILGRMPNVLAVVEMGSWILIQMDNITWFQTQTYDGPVQKLRFRNSFLVGLTDRVIERLNEFYQQSQLNPSAKALTISLKGEAQQYLIQQYPYRRTHQTSSHSVSREAYNAGRSAGDGVSFSHSGRQIDSGTKLLT